MLKVIELFGGIGACSKALERLNIEHKVVDYVEIDKYAVKSYNAIHNTNFEPQDITQWDKDTEVDLIMHGSPCQDFSLAGKQAGGDEGSGTRSSLLYETIRIVSNLKPKYVIWENVKNVLSQKHRHNFDNYLKEMEQLGYTNYYQVLNAKDYGIPQNRERVFTISIIDNHTENDETNSLIVKDFKFPPKQDLKLKLKDMLEDEVDEKYYLSEYILKKIINTEHKRFTNNDLLIEPIDYRYDEGLRNRVDKEVIPTLTCKVGTAGFSGQPLLKIKEATKKGYKEAYDGDSVNIAYPESETRRGRVGDQVAQTLQCNDNMGVVESKTMKNILCNELVKSGILKNGTIINHSYTNGLNGKNPNSRQKLEDYIESENGILPTMTTRPDCLGYYNNLRIRKLTPKECFRLMGFDDEDFEKAALVNSNAQLYKQAGNSIVVNVLEDILKNLLKEEEND